ncbi:hypothetical protein F2P81_008265 [Scophthalmus maximus]|uniref:Uncharacterized protein n=1 Tax=Scophthalmus maximus TaxID=52904 RepID=A0A6A4T7S0_SCOMX|nr:hypothetical protein F2P81_008265 [Scophthalmus maximus]
MAVNTRAKPVKFDLNSEYGNMRKSFGVALTYGTVPSMLSAPLENGSDEVIQVQQLLFWTLAACVHLRLIGGFATTRARKRTPYTVLCESIADRSEWVVGRLNLYQRQKLPMDGTVKSKALLSPSRREAKPTDRLTAPDNAADFVPDLFFHRTGREKKLRALRSVDSDANVCSECNISGASRTDILMLQTLLPEVNLQSSKLRFVNSYSSYSACVQHNTESRATVKHCHHSNLAAMCMPCIIYGFGEDVKLRLRFTCTAALIQTATQHHAYDGMSHRVVDP